MFFFPDYVYIILVVPALIISLICRANVKSTYRRCDKIKNARGISGAFAAEAVLRAAGVRNVSINMISGELSDHFDPRTNTINLSKKVYSGTSVAAVGIACHEAGHAVRYAVGYAPIKLRAKILPVANFGSSAGILIAVLGYFIGMPVVANIGILLFAFVVLFRLATLPVEFNASKRALDAISESGLLFEDEQKNCKKVLVAAALTYVAALLVSLANLLRLIIRFSGKRRN